MSRGDPRGRYFCYGLCLSVSRPHGFHGVILRTR